MLGVSIFLGCEKLNQEGETNTPFTITSIGNTLVTLYRGWPGGIPVEGLPNGVYLEYRKGKENWQTVNYSCFELSDGEYVQFRAAREEGNERICRDWDQHLGIDATGDGVIKVSGNIMSLFDKTSERNSVPKNGFRWLFYGCEHLVDASELKLPATNLADFCYSEMFEGCRNLTTAPELPATNLVDSCYDCMFYDCVKLNYVKAMFTTFYEGDVHSWLYNVSPTGTFVKNKDATWDDEYVIPRGWIVKCQ